MSREVTIRPDINQPNRPVLARPDLNRPSRPLSRPDFNQPRGTFPGVVAHRDEGGAFRHGPNDHHFNRSSFANFWNASRYRHGIHDHRLRYCGPFSSSYYCYGYRPLYYYPRAYPYAYSTAYFYDNWPYYAPLGSSLYSGSVAFAEPGYATSPSYAGDTYVQPESAPSTSYVDSTVNAYPGEPSAAPSENAPEAGQREAAGEPAYQSLTEPGANSALAEGNAAFRAGKFDDARQAYSRAVLSDERDGYAKMLYATANFAAGDYRLAATAVRRSLLTTPELVTFPIDVRSLYADPTALYGQMDALAQRLTASPEDRDAALLLAYLHYSIGEPGPARDMFKLLAESDSNDALASQLYAAATRAAESTQGQPGRASPKSSPGRAVPPSKPSQPTGVVQPVAPDTPSNEPPPHPEVP